MTEAMTLERAAKASCVRCKVVLMSAPSAADVVLVNFAIPSVDARDRVFLCGDCGIRFQEFLTPALERDNAFQDLAAELRQSWLRQ